MPSNDDDSSGSKPKNRGHMFLVDIPTYAAVCDLRDADVAAVYLILAAGTGADNRTSTWSREAVKNRTGLTWRRASACCDKLEKHALIRWLSGKSSRKPKIDLPPLETRRPVQKEVAALADRIKTGEQPRTGAEIRAATIGKDAGWLAEDHNGVWRFVRQRPMVKAYLPMSLVGDETGRAIAGSTIVERIRLSRNYMAFRLLIDLYALQDLAEHGGVDRARYEKKFAREKAGATSDIQVWRFRNKGESVALGDDLKHHSRKLTAAEINEGWKKGNKSAGFFGTADILHDAGALEWVYYLAEHDKSDSTRIYPVAVERHGKVVWSELETIVGSFAVRAACALTKAQLSGIRPDAQYYERAMPAVFLLPADRLARQATVVGIPRLRYRAKTSNTARWRKELVDDAESWIAMFRGIINEHAPELLAEADRRLADFNDASMKTSTLVQRDINDTFWSGKHGAAWPPTSHG